jgi:hypothetical protein
MNADELRDFKQALEAQAWANYRFLRRYIELRQAELEANDYKMPLPELLVLMRLMKKTDDYIRIALGMPTVIKDRKVIQKQTAGINVIILKEE